MNLTLLFKENFEDEKLAGQHRTLEPIAGKTYRLGRLAACDIRINYLKASRLHASIRWDEDVQCWFLFDGGYYEGREYHPSSNGVWLNGDRVLSGKGNPPKPNPEPIGYYDCILLGGVGELVIVYDQHATLHDEEHSDGGELPPMDTVSEPSIASVLANVSAVPKSRQELLWRLLLVLVGLLVAVVIIPLML